eukprot:4806795-Amphidinium_carterae.1
MATLLLILLALGFDKAQDLYAAMRWDMGVYHDPDGIRPGTHYTQHMAAAYIMDSQNGFSKPG